MFRTLDVLRQELSKLPPGNPEAIMPDTREVEVIVKSGYGALEVKGTSARQAIEKYLDSIPSLPLPHEPPSRFLEALVVLYRALDVQDVCETVFRVDYSKGECVYNLARAPIRPTLEIVRLEREFFTSLPPLILRDARPYLKKYIEACIRGDFVRAFESYKPSEKAFLAEKYATTPEVTLAEALEAYRTPSSYALPQIDASMDVAASVLSITEKRAWMTVGMIASSRINLLVQRFCNRKTQPRDLSILVKECQKYAKPEGPVFDLGPLATHFALENNPGWGKLQTKKPESFLTIKKEWIGFTLNPTGAYQLGAFFEREPGRGARGDFGRGRKVAYKLEGRPKEDWPFEGKERGVLLRIVNEIWQKNETIDTYIHALITTVRRSKLVVDTGGVGGAGGLPPALYKYEAGKRLIRMGEVQIIQNILASSDLSRRLAYVDQDTPERHAEYHKRLSDKKTPVRETLAELGCRNIEVAETILRHSKLPVACSIAVKSAQRIAHLFALPLSVPTVECNVDWVNRHLIQAMVRSEYGTQKISSLSSIFLTHISKGVWALSPFAEALIDVEFVSKLDGVDNLYRAFLLDIPDVLVSDSNKIVYAYDPTLTLAFKAQGIVFEKRENPPIAFPPHVKAADAQIARSSVMGERVDIDEKSEWAALTEVYRFIQQNGFVFDSYKKESGDACNVFWNRTASGWTYGIGECDDSVRVRGTRGVYYFKFKQQ